MMEIWKRNLRKVWKSNISNFDFCGFSGEYCIMYNVNSVHRVFLVLNHF